MYAVIKTGGKQYRVHAGDVLVVEKLAGEPGAEVRFDQVLMVGDDGGATVGAPLVDGAAVTATLIETRKGEKVKIFKKIRRQGYRRTRGHRQSESVLRVTGLSAGGKSDKWDGVVSLVTRAELNARARGLAFNGSYATAPAITPAGVDAEAVVTDGSRSPVVHGAVVEHAGPAPQAKAQAKAKAKAKPAAEARTEAAPKKKAAPKKAKPAGGEDA